MTGQLKYVLITPARNEEAYIEKTISAVVAQTILPERYIIVSDGSTDRTDEIVRHYAATYDFVSLVRGSEKRKGGKNFAAKVRAFFAGYDHLSHTNFDLVGNLDADVSFGPDYFEQLLQKFSADPKLGISGGEVLEMVGNRPLRRGASEHSVCGAVQLFRRQCYEDIRGFREIEFGGEDSAAEIMARAAGWNVKHQASLPVVANRPVLTGYDSFLGTRYNKGRINYVLGYHPLFQLAVVARNLLQRPWIFSSLWMLAGYIYAAGSRQPLVLSADTINYLRTEQLSRLGLARPPKPRSHP